MRVDNHDLRQLRQHRIDRMYVQGAEPIRKSALLLRSDGLIAKKQDLVFDQQFTEAVNSGLRQLIGEFDALHNCAEGRGQAGCGDGHTWIMPCHSAQRAALFSVSWASISDGYSGDFMLHPQTRALLDFIEQHAVPPTHTLS